MTPLTYLAWLQPIYYNSSFVFIHINITNVLLLVKTLMKKYYFFQVQFLKILFFFRFSFWKYYFFPGSVFENITFFQVQFLRIRLLNRSATTLISQQPGKHKAAATLISNYKLQNNCSLKKYISKHKYKNYVNLCKLIYNKWCFNNKKYSLISNHKL